MAVDLTKAFETENGIKVGEVILPDSIVSLIRSSKPTYSGDLISSIEYYNSLTQINANRISKADFTYSGDNVSTQVNTYYGPDGVTAVSTESIAYSYTSDLMTKVEVT
jgi:hypothetical protein